MRIGLVLLALIVSACTDENIDVEGPVAPVLSEWLDTNSNIKNALKIEQDANPSYYYGGTLTELSYDDWSAEDKAALDEAFQRAWYWLYVSTETTILGTEEFSMPLECVYCEGRLITNPTFGPFSIIPEALSKRAYIAYVAQSLALEAGSGLGWSILASPDAELHHFFNTRALMHRVGGTTEFFIGEPGGGGDARIKYVGRVSPATPIYVYKWLVRNDILQSTQEATILALLQWMRTHAVHFYGSATYATMNEHWGYPSQTSAYHVMTGTIRDTELLPQHWTAGCHGTIGFLKSVLKAVNIPAQPIYTCGHAQMYFPTLDLYLDHGDNPYNATVINQPVKNISGILISPATYTARFSATPDYLNPADPMCNSIGQAATDF